VNTWKVILATLVIFGAGVITGALVVNLSARMTAQPVAPPPPIHVQVEKREQQQQTDLLHRMDKQLELTSEQHGKLEKILKDSQKRTKFVRDQISPQLRAELERVRKEIMAELTPDQQKKFEALPHTSTSLINRKPDKGEDEMRSRKKGGKKGMTNSPALLVPTNVPLENQKQND
jgi:Spy/CpxP family protein refolding chaperone